MYAFALLIIFFMFGLIFDIYVLQTVYPILLSIFTNDSAIHQAMVPSLSGLQALCIILMIRYFHNKRVIKLNTKSDDEK